jgi:NADH-quinone oxidoreductase subunit N
MDNLYSTMIVMPELLLSISGFLLLIIGLLDRTNVMRVVTMLTIGAFIVSAVVLFVPQRLAPFLGGQFPVPAFGHMFIDDAIARFVKLLLLVAAGLSLLLSGRYLEHEKIARPEYPVLILFATLGMMLMVSASDLLALYVGLELQSLALYVLAAFRRDHVRSSEAGLKYFVLGALSSGIILYGVSLIYGTVGATDFNTIGLTLGHLSGDKIGAIIGLIFVVAAMAFKVSAVPFHMWTPDVYEGAPTSVTAFFASAPKIASLIALTRLLYLPFGSLSHQWSFIIVVLAVASMLLGSFAGLAQSSMKRLLAYSSIANVGFALAGLATVGPDGVQAMLIYLAIYFINTLGVFGVLMLLRRKGVEAEKMTDLAGLGKSSPFLALVMMLLMFSLAGVPPLAGFFGKYLIFIAVVKAGMVPLAVVGVLSSVVSAFYYLRVIKIMYFDENTDALDVPSIDNLAMTGLVAIVVLVVGFTFWPSPIIDAAHRAIAGSLFIHG